MESRNLSYVAVGQVARPIQGAMREKKRRGHKLPLVVVCVARGSARISLHGVRTRLGERRTPLAEYTATRRAG